MFFLSLKREKEWRAKEWRRDHPWGRNALPTKCVMTTQKGGPDLAREGESEPTEPPEPPTPPPEPLLSLDILRYQAKDHSHLQPTPHPKIATTNEHGLTLTF
jgi:hypothetical protein